LLALKFFLIKNLKTIEPIPNTNQTVTNLTNNTPNVAVEISMFSFNNKSIMLASVTTISAGMNVKTPLVMMNNKFDLKKRNLDLFQQKEK